MDEKLTLKKDFAFTRLFSKKGNESFLIDFLESILGIEINDIQIIPEARLSRVSEDNKYGTLDLKATIDNGTIINIEMQMQNTQKIEKRSAFYAGKIMSEQLKKSQKYNEIGNIVMINILNYNFLKVKEYHNQTLTVLKEYRDYEIDNPVKYHFIELPKFRKAKPDLENKLYQWLSFIDGENKELVEMAVKKNKEIEKANEEWEYLTGDEEIKRLEFLKFKAECDKASREAYIVEVASKEAREKGMKQGMKQGMQQGMKQGIEQGVKEGEKNKAVEIAKKMLKKGTDIKLIKEFTDLKEQEIDEIKKLL